MAAVHLPDDPPGAADTRPRPGFFHPLHDRLFERFGIEVPVYPWPAKPRRLLRVSAHAYNDIEQYERLAEAVCELLSKER